MLAFYTEIVFIAPSLFMLGYLIIRKMFVKLKLIHYDLDDVDFNLVPWFNMLMAVAL